MPRPDIDTIIAELTPKHRAKRWTLIAAVVIAFIVGVGLSYQFLIKERIDPSLLVSDAKLLMGQDRLDEAILKLKLAYKHDREHIDATFLLAICYDRIGNVPDAIKWQKRTVQMKPEDPRARTQLAVLLEKNNQLEEAIQEWESISELQPGDPYVQGRLEELRSRLPQ